MGWWDTVKGMGTDAAAGVGSFSYRTAAHLFEQAAVLPKVGYSIFFHPKTQQVARHALRITYEDLLPIIFATTVNNWLTSNGEEYLADNPNPNWLSANTILLTGMTIVQATTWLFNFRKEREMDVRTLVLSIEAARLLPTASTTPPMQLCKEQKCGAVKVIKGKARDSITYLATKPFIWGLGYLPYADSQIGALTLSLFNAYFTGRYISTVALTDLCNKHQQIYLQEYPELALALGLGHEAMTRGMTYLLSSQTGIPAIYFEAAVRQFALFVSFSIAAHMQFPKEVKTSTRSLPDPVAAYQSLIGNTVDVIGFGLAKKIPLLLKNPPSDIPWKKIFDGTRATWQHPHMKMIEKVFLPSLLQNQNGFLKDNIIAPNWDGLRQSLIESIAWLEKKKKKYVVRVASTCPNATAQILHPFTKTPKPITRVALKLVGNREFMQQMKLFRMSLEGMRADDPAPIEVNKSALPLREAIESKVQVIEEVQVPPPPPLPTVNTKEAKAVINSASSGSPIPAIHQVLQTSSPRKKDSEVQARTVLKQQRFFSTNPKSVLRLKPNPLVADAKKESVSTQLTEATFFN